MLDYWSVIQQFSIWCLQYETLAAEHVAIPFGSCWSLTRKIWTLSHKNQQSRKMRPLLTMDPQREPWIKRAIVENMSPFLQMLYKTQAPFDLFDTTGATRAKIIRNPEAIESERIESPANHSISPYGNKHL